MRSKGAVLAQHGSHGEDSSVDAVLGGSGRTRQQNEVEEATWQMTERLFRITSSPRYGPSELEQICCHSFQSLSMILPKPDDFGALGQSHASQDMHYSGQAIWRHNFFYFVKTADKD